MRRFLIRLVSLAGLAWAFGLVWFIVTLQDPAPLSKTDTIVVLTGGPGRIQRGLDVLQAGQAKRMLVSGVDPVVRPKELAKLEGVSPAIFQCCVDLGKMAIDTRSNAIETAAWLTREKARSVRLVTTDWHMRRARFELDRVLDPGVSVVQDGVVSNASFVVLFTEYHKWLFRRLGGFLGA
jgi:uncharacterized SAM-binding protein YcdF (DUF218 family)